VQRIGLRYLEHFQVCASHRAENILLLLPQRKSRIEMNGPRRAVGDVVEIDGAVKFGFGQGVDPGAPPHGVVNHLCILLHQACSH
jgi:hypothetical protein